MEAISHFARALGAARSGDSETAQKAIDTLGTLHEKLPDASSYWAKQVDIQRLSAEAWLAYQDKQQDQALDTMRRAADLEASTEKHPVTPGEILPARELLADMLLDMGRYDEAQTAYQTALERSPNRFNSLYGLGRAAQLAGDKNEATGYYQQLVETSIDDADREQLQQAKAFLAKQ